jgi:hypothetical protein
MLSHPKSVAQGKFRVTVNTVNVWDAICLSPFRPRICVIMDCAIMVVDSTWYMYSM